MSLALASRGLFGGLAPIGGSPYPEGYLASAVLVDVTVVELDVDLTVDGPVVDVDVDEIDVEVEVDA